MYTTLTRKDVKKGKFDYDDYYYVFDAASQTLRTIYTILGWHHMTETLHKPNDTMEDLCKKAIAHTEKTGGQGSCATGGMKVTTKFESVSDNPEEDLLVIDVSFEVV